MQWIKTETIITAAGEAPPVGSRQICCAFFKIQPNFSQASQTHDS